ncbi:ATP-binding protein [Hyunsoonleella sp. SJ7]|uniref:histidine kinase n=1 Tax=Hyunsoonleella aquatilis TaxID=2762758 RepID=A0A923HGA1_9FLAO|nr:7TM diverse intracellular signaling domain-containing protein [Hyunsoonleella aquatilis]MBC3757892.1 ATP-binding protein [Hyunsoonleella aquatilis]
MWLVKYILLIVSLANFGNYFAQNGLDINKLSANFDEFTISKHYTFRESENALSIHQVLEDDGLFQFEEKSFLNSGVFHPYNWLKIKFLNTSNESDFVFEFNQTYIDSLEFYVVKGREIVQAFPKKGLHFEANNNSSFLSNKYAYTYPINISKNDTISFYIHAVVNDGAFRVVNKIWTKKGYERRTKDIKIRSSYLIFFTGFTVLVIIISIAMFFFSRQRLYLYYAGFVAVIFANLLGLRYFISPLFFEKYLFFGNNFLEMFTLVQAFFVMQYLRHFFYLKTYYPKLYKGIGRIAMLTFLFFVVALFLRRFEWFYALSYYSAKLLLLIVTVGFYTIAIKLCFKKEIMAYYFVMAYFPLMLVVIHYLMTALKLTSGYSPIEWEFVIFFEIFVLTIAMAHRYYLLIQENIAYQKKLYEQRLKISRDLHDNIGAQLTFIISSIENLPYGFKISDSKLKAKLQSISAFTKETIYELRDTIWAMNKNKISLEDLQVRISNFVEKANAHADGTKFTFSVDDAISKDIEFGAIKGMNIYRIIQEAINNAFKYADAEHVSVSILDAKDNLEIKVEDDGKGFDPKAVEGGNGLNNMKKRAKEIGATINIESELGKGTNISVLVKY